MRDVHFTLLTERKGRSLYLLERSALHLYVCVSVCLTITAIGLYRLSEPLPLPTVPKFGINICGTKVDRCTCKDFLISIPFQNRGRFLGNFRSYERRGVYCLQNYKTSMYLFNELKI